jgi:hypothetical protein
MHSRDEAPPSRLVRPYPRRRGGAHPVRDLPICWKPPPVAASSPRACLSSSGAASAACAPAPAPIAEIAASYDVPLGTARVLIADLLADGLVTIHPTAPSGDRAGARGGAPKRRFEAVKVMAAEGIPVEVACRLIDVSVSCYYG